MDDRYLFKAKRIDNGEWIVGNLLIIAKINFFICTGKIKLDGALKGHICPEMYAVDKSTLCRCTGLLDGRKNLIWENDIINTEVGKAVVGWDRCTWRIKWIQYTIWRKDLWYWATEEDWHTEVVGNIFDNPELLEVE